MVHRVIVASALGCAVMAGASALPGCSSSSGGGGAIDGGGANGGSGGSGGSNGGSGGVTGPVKDCGIHSSIGSCGPVSDNCNCSSSCLEFGVGSYQCVWTCNTDADCTFNVKDPSRTYVWSGTCVHAPAGSYCQASAGGSGGGGGGDGGSGNIGGSGGTAGAGGNGGGGGGLPAGCVDSNVTASCDPLTNSPCAGDESCDLGQAGAGYTLECYPPPNTSGPGDSCDSQNGPFCVGGFHCTSGVCKSFCCSDAECSGSACTPISASAGTLGTCP